MEIPSAEQSVNLMVDTFHKIAQSHMPVSVGIGTVLSPPPDLKIAWNNIILESDQLYIDQFLLPNYQRQMIGQEAVTLPSAEGNIRTNTQSRKGGYDKPRFVSHTHKINDSYKADIEGEGNYKASSILTDCGLMAGDLVSILPLEGGQKFIVLGKIIYLPEFQFESNEDSGGTGDSSSFINF